MTRKDERMVETNQSLNNIKMLKLYSWQDLFEQRINTKRDKEISVLRKQGSTIALLIGFVYLFPNMMPAVCYCCYIGFQL
jgi:ATP-binding cassette subfamily C (CFTR/MRP) protein 1